jgi:hypothetical protein
LPGKLDSATTEQIIYGEFDGKRKERVLGKIIGEQNADNRSSNPSVGGSNPPRRASKFKGLGLIAYPFFFIDENLSHYCPTD